MLEWEVLVAMLFPPPPPLKKKRMGEGGLFGMASSRGDPVVGVNPNSPAP